MHQQEYSRFFKGRKFFFAMLFALVVVTMVVFGMNPGSVHAATRSPLAANCSVSAGISINLADIARPIQGTNNTTCNQKVSSLVLTTDILHWTGSAYEVVLESGPSACISCSSLALQAQYTSAISGQIYRVEAYSAIYASSAKVSPHASMSDFSDCMQYDYTYFAIVPCP
jgi:hypothetical protein